MDSLCSLLRAGGSLFKSSRPLTATSGSASRYGKHAADASLVYHRSLGLSCLVSESLSRQQERAFWGILKYSRFVGRCVSPEAIMTVRQHDSERPAQY
jgi:hypothetical protein